MVRRQGGFTLVELLVTMVVFVLVIAAASQVFTGLLTQFKQQNKMAETHIEGAVGLGILRRDLEHAGFGLPWAMNGIGYTEAGVISIPAATPWTDRNLNDGPPAGDDTTPRGATCPGTPFTCNPRGNSNPPAGIRSMDDAYQAATFGACPGAGSNCSDVLSIKSSNVAMNAPSQAWTNLQFASTPVNGLSGENFAPTDRVIVLAPGTTPTNRRTLVTDAAGNWFTTFNTTGGFAPLNFGQTNIVYGISPGVPIMPFNRADYYIRRPASGMPPTCAPNTGILYKAVLRHDNNTAFTEYPLMSCVANLQVLYHIIDPVAGDTWTGDTTYKTAAELRAQLREVRVYILAQEGQRDPNFTYSPTTIYVGDAGIGGRNYSIGTNTHYHWRLYSIVVQPSNMR